jgi:serpin B
MRKVIFPEIVIFCLVVAVFLSGCSHQQPEPSIQTLGNSQVTGGVSQNTNVIPQPAEGTVEYANNQFTFDLYKNLSDNHENTGKNIFFSPFSLSSVMAVTYEGARGRTAEEIRAVMHFPENTSQIRQGFSEIYSGINRKQKTFVLRTANALWVEKTYRIKPEFIRTAQQYYQANATNLDFINNAEASRTTINKWVEGETNNKIRDLLPAGSIDSATPLVITNAVYFNGKWEIPFNPEETYARDFHLASGQITRIPFMNRGDHYRYSEIDDDKMLELPYNGSTGKNLSMLIYLPETGNETTLGNTLDTRRISDLERKLSETRVVIWIPKFTMETGYNLPETLSGLGMPTAFKSSADFSGIDGANDLFIKGVVHKAFVDVNEEGTEAAAASTVYFTKGSGNQPASFEADHPFLFMIKDCENGNILFIGRVMNPNE